MLPFKIEGAFVQWVNEWHALPVVKGIQGGGEHPRVSPPAPSLSSCVMLGKLVSAL